MLINKFDKMKKILLIISIFVSLFMVSGTTIVNKAESRIDSALTEQNVYISILANNIKYPEVVMSQIMIESGHLTSDLCINNNNLLGMTVPSRRKTTAINEDGYAEYKNWMESIVDYKLYQDFILLHNKLDTKKKYISFLQRTYAKSKNYKSNLLTMSRIYELRNPYNFTGS